MQVDVLEYYETSVRSASAQFLIPAVLRVRMYVSKREFKAGRLSLSRRNIVLRDHGQCQCAPGWILLGGPAGACVRGCLWAVYVCCRCCLLMTTASASARARTVVATAGTCVRLSWGRFCVLLSVPS